MLSSGQLEDIYTNLGQGGLLNLGSIGPHGWFVMISHGLAYALLQHDMIARYRLRQINQYRDRPPCLQKY